MAVRDNLRELMYQRDLTQSAFANSIGKTHGAVSQWLSARTEPSMPTLLQICDVYGLELSDLISDTDGLYAKAHAALRAPGAMRPHTMPTAPVPLRGRVHAGKPTDPDEIEDTVLIPKFLLDSDPECYACEAEGDCMNRVYPEGCVVVVSPNKEPQNGSVAVVTIDGRDAVMRRMYRTPNTLVLSPDSFNPDHTDIIITADDEHVVAFGGRVVWFQSREEME